MALHTNAHLPHPAQPNRHRPCLAPPSGAAVLRHPSLPRGPRPGCHHLPEPHRDRPQGKGCGARDGWVGGAARAARDGGLGRLREQGGQGRPSGCACRGWPDAPWSRLQSRRAACCTPPSFPRRATGARARRLATSCLSLARLQWIMCWCPATPGRTAPGCSPAPPCTQTAATCWT